MTSSHDAKRPPIPLDRMPIPDALACVEPFCAARPEEIAALAAVAQRLRRPAGSPLLVDGQVPDALYVLLRGRVNLVSSSQGDRDLILFSLGPGDVVGESCVFDDRPMSSSAVVATPSELVRLPAQAVRDQARRSPEVLVRLMGLLHDRLRDAEAVASSLALCDVEQRLRRTLARLVRRQGRRAAAEPGWVLAPVPTQSELARMVGSCRETVSRTLSAMARAGLLSSRGRRMILTDQLVQGGA